MRPMPELKVTYERTSDLLPYVGNAKKHPHEQVDHLVKSMETFGMCDPIGVWHNDAGEMEIVEGHGRVLALKRLGIETVPVIYLDHLTDEQRRAYAHVHNQLTLSSGFDIDVLNVELGKIVDIDMEQFGFDVEVPHIADEEDVSDEFRECGKDVETTNKCPMCGYEW